jgi:hypothetical protein
MNGATADPDVNAIRLPNRAKQQIIGKSQNCFRSFMNDQSSIKNSPIGMESSSKLSREMGRRTRLADDPIAVEVGPQPLSHRILAQPGAKDPYRGYDEVEDHA